LVAGDAAHEAGDVVGLVEVFVEYYKSR